MVAGVGTRPHYMLSDDVVVCMEPPMSDTEEFEELESYRRNARRGRFRFLLFPLAVLVVCGACVAIWVGVGSIAAYSTLAREGHEQIRVWPAGAFTYAFRSDGEHGRCGGRIEVTPVSSATSMMCTGPDGRIRASMPLTRGAFGP